MKNKRSFFERLTGSVSNEESPEKESKVPMHSKKDVPAEEDAEEGELTVDVYQTPDDIYIQTIVAGVRPEDLDISITRDMVTVRGSRALSREIDKEDYFHRELYWGSFSRTILLPQEVDVDASEAIEKHGLLTIKLPKMDKSRQTKLKVRSN
ncbi:MAG: Hsp20/alpha crystallin family protein [bacterium]|nr:Hsp20/alpha crystallin family protein [bacterium]